MPIVINKNLPAAQVLAREGIFVMPLERAAVQDIRPLRIAILNIMPTKERTETQLMRLLANSPLQIEVVLLHPATHQSKNTSAEHLDLFYQTFGEVKDQYFDGLIITGAPVEQIPFEEVTYWKELRDIMEWSKHNVFATMYICWAAQAGLYYHYGIEKHQLEKKLFGIFRHTKAKNYMPILRGFDDEFWAPHSRYTGVSKEDIEKHPKLEVLCEGKESGVYIASARDGRSLFITGHPEYTANTLRAEYERDVAKGIPIDVPKNYFADDDPNKEVVVKWRGHGNLLFYNWLNYYVYQKTPYDLAAIREEEEKYGNNRKAD
ncbi:homoserine O-succinyltransferase [Christensenellaceae bacterium OttesenSCG-928-K19]|nr:homoserine O-succinyltransferase [Christensenellaceae bacterium OttesenSCG-928-K19]